MEEIEKLDFLQAIADILSRYQIIRNKFNYEHIVNKIIVPQKSILDLFKIDLLNHRKARLALYYHLHMQPSEINEMEYYDFEDLLYDLSELLKEKAEAEKKAYGDQKDNSPKAPNYKQPKMPSMPKMPRMPRF